MIQQAMWRQIVTGILAVVGIMVMGSSTLSTAHAADVSGCPAVAQQVVVSGDAARFGTIPSDWASVGEVRVARPAAMIRAYQLPGAITVEQAISRVTAMGLRGEPNCYISANSWSIAGSGGWSPISGSASTAFSTQHAFTSQTGGIRLYNQQGQRTVPELGTGVIVGVVDSIDPSAVGGSGSTFTFSIPSPSGSFPVAVTDIHASLAPAYVVPTSTSLAYTGSHGPFVISLIHHVAPAASYRLYGVLNTNGTGTLFGGVSGIDAFTDYITAQAGDNLAVLNLSWGVVGTKSTPSSLALVLDDALNANIAVVAAAGNDSAGTSAQPTSSPASYSNVVPVGASNTSAARTCYANTSWLFAPGGEGIGTACTPPTLSSQCATASCIIGYDPLSSTNYSSWGGSSFSTAFVSGIVVLMRQVDPALSPATIHSTMSSWATAPVSVANAASLVDSVR